MDGEISSLASLVQTISDVVGRRFVVEDDRIAGETVSVSLKDVRVDEVMAAIASMDSLSNAKLSWVKRGESYVLVSDANNRRIGDTTRKMVIDDLVGMLNQAAILANGSPSELTSSAKAGNRYAQKISGRDKNRDPFRDSIQIIDGLIKNSDIRAEDLGFGTRVSIPVSDLPPALKRHALDAWGFLGPFKITPDGNTQLVGDPPVSVEVKISPPGGESIPIVWFGLGFQGAFGKSIRFQNIIGDAEFVDRWENKFRENWQSDSSVETQDKVFYSGGERLSFYETLRKSGANFIGHIPSDIKAVSGRKPDSRWLAWGQTSPRLMAKRKGSVLVVSSVRWFLSDADQERISWALQQCVERISKSNPGGCATWSDLKQLIAAGSDQELFTFREIDGMYNILPFWRPLIEYAASHPEFEKDLFSENGALLTETLLQRLSKSGRAGLDIPQNYRSARRIKLNITHFRLGAKPGEFEPVASGDKDTYLVTYRMEILNRDGSKNGEFMGSARIKSAKMP